MPPVAFLAVLGALSPAPLAPLVDGGPRQEPTPRAPSELTLDERLDALPPIGCQQHFDPTTRVWTVDPLAASLQTFVAERALDNEQWRRALVECGAIRWRKRWVEGAPLLVSVRLPFWIPSAALTVTPRATGSVRAGDTNGGFVCGMFDPEQAPTFWWQHGARLGALAPGVQSLPCDVSIERAGPQFFGSTPEERLVWRGSLDLSVEPVESIEEILTPVSGAEIDALVRSALKLMIVETSVPDPASTDEHVDALAAEVELRVDEREHREFHDTSVALDLELLRDGEAIASAWAVPIALADLRHAAHPGAPAPRGFVVRNSVDSLPLAAAQSAAERARWSLRIRGDGLGALALWDATRYWKGELVLPLADALARYEAERTQR